jgi:hypoxanthine phosphoribosyltransferase
MLTDWQSQFLNVTWDEFRIHTFTLSQNIKKSGKSFDLIVAIARGGLTLSQLLSDSLRLPIATFTIESYKDLKQAKLPHIVYGLSASLTNKKILLVDDVSDTGKTFLRGISYLEELGTKRKDITTCCVHLKPHSEYKPDFFVDTSSAWIIYPYEVRETIEQLKTAWKKEKISPDEMKQRFLSFGFSASEIQKYLM